MSEMDGELDPRTISDLHIEEQLSDYERKRAQSAEAAVGSATLLGISERHNPVYIRANVRWFDDDPNKYLGGNNGIRSN